MAAKSASGDAPELIDRGRWDGEVVGSTSYTFEWGTHAFDARIRAFDDGEGYVEVEAASRIGAGPSTNDRQQTADPFGFGR